MHDATFDCVWKMYGNSLVAGFICVRVYSIFGNKLFIVPPVPTLECEIILLKEKKRNKCCLRDSFDETHL